MTTSRSIRIRKYGACPVPENIEDMPKMPARLHKFCQSYAMDADGAKAVRFAKIEFNPEVYREWHVAYNLLRQRDVQLWVSKYRAELGELNFDIKEQILRQWEAMRRANVEDLYDADGNLKDPREWPDECKQLLAGIEIEETMTGTGDAAALVRTKKVKLESKLAAGAHIMKSIGGFVEKREVSGPGGKPLNMGQAGPTFIITVGAETKTYNADGDKI